MKKHVLRPLHIICGTSASIILFCASFAELPQTSLTFVHYLRNFRKYHSFSFIFYGTSANITHFCTLLAEFPQTPFISVHLLRNFRKHHSILHIICRTSASIIQFCALFAEVPQIGCRFRLTYLEAFTTSKNFRKAKTGMEKAPLLSFFS